MKVFPSSPIYNDILDALVKCKGANEEFAAIAQQALEVKAPNQACDGYFSTVELAAAAAPPPFCTDQYKEIYHKYSANSRWLATSLMANAQREGQGATDLWTLAACAEDQLEQSLLKQHAIDESRHAEMYLLLLDLNFPGLVDEVFRKEMNGLSPGFSKEQTLQPFINSDYAKNPTIDDFVQMNIAEIRTTFHHLMQRQALEQHCPPENIEPSRKVLDSLLQDELGHVAYTAHLVEKKMCEMGMHKLEVLYTRRLKDFNQITISEFGNRIFG